MIVYGRIDMIGKETTKLVLEQPSETITFEFDNYGDTSEFVERLYYLCLAASHDRDNIAEAFYNLGEELTKDQYNG
jgi:hypothetical protein